MIKTFIALSSLLNKSNLYLFLQKKLFSKFYLFFNRLLFFEKALSRRFQLAKKLFFNNFCFFDFLQKLKKLRTTSRKMLIFSNYIFSK